MQTSNLFPPLLSGLAKQAAQRIQPPQWLLHEGRQRLVLLLNHILMQQPSAMQRLARQNGRVIHIQAGHQRTGDVGATPPWTALTLSITAAGLFNLAPAHARPDLHLHITDTHPARLAQAALRGEKPPLHIMGDVRMATELQWLIDNVRWDVERDLVRLLGEGPAKAVAALALTIAHGLSQFVSGCLAARTVEHCTVAPGAAPTQVPCTASVNIS